MNIGVLKERKPDENRVALRPIQAGILKESGHRILVESGAGDRAGFPDEEYRADGATISTKNTILDECSLILKVKTPLKEEYEDYRERHILTAFLHLDENIPAEDIKRLIRSGFMGIAWEWIEKDNAYPILQVMSKLTGYLFAQRATELCTIHAGQLCGGYEDFAPGINIMIIGLGTIGMSALKYAVDNHYHVYLVEKHPESINERLNARFKTALDYISRYGIEVVIFDNDNPGRTKAEIGDLLPRMDIVLNGAVRRDDLPRHRMRYMIDEAMVRTMKKGSVICDATACDREFIETCVSSESLDHYDVIHGVIHYNCDHIPAGIGRMATELLTRETFPYIIEIANKGIWRAISENESLRRAICCYRARITNKHVSGRKGMAFTDLMELIGSHVS